MNEQSCSGEERCYYPGVRCDCGGKKDEPQWRCRGSGAACPATLPVPDSSCESDMDMPLTCPYADGSECRCDHEQWRCEMPPEPPGAGGAPPEPPAPPAGGAPVMPAGGRPGGPGPMDPGGREG